MTQTQTNVVQARGGKTQFRLAVVVKRSYRLIGNRLALDDLQDPIYDDAHYKSDAGTAPILWDNDHFAFKELCDVVVRGHAYPPEAPHREALVGVRWEKGERWIRVWGDRHLESSPGGRWRFSQAERFERLPVIWSRAYGGCDHVVLERDGDPVAEAFATVREDCDFSDSTPSHYPRNPLGIGYYLEAASLREGDPVPNLEFPDDLFTPDRLISAGPKGWPAQPLPAACDWYDQGWFPRCAYLGLSVPLRSTEVAECIRGWATTAVLENRDLMSPTPKIPDLRFCQGAAPGLQLADITAGSAFQLTNWFAHAPQRIVRLPGEVPVACIEISPGKETRCDPVLGSVVLDCEDERMTLVWHCRCAAERPYTPAQLVELKHTVIWK
jgi:hypothetical protein